MSLNQSIQLYFSTRTRDDDLDPIMRSRTHMMCMACFTKAGEVDLLLHFDMFTLY